MLVNADQPLGVSIFISIAIPFKGSWEMIWMFILKGKDVFTKILLGTTM